MKRKTTKLNVVILIVTLLFSSCRGGSSDLELTGNTNTLPAAGDTLDSQEEVTLPPFPTSIDITLEEGAAVSSTIGPEGGSFSAVDANGTEFVLTIPEGALLYDEEIAMTPIASVEGDVIGDTYLAGVNLQPEGLQFLELVSIEITGAVIEEGAVGFSANNGGLDFHLIPSTSAGSSVTITTTHFSEFGVSQEEISDFISNVSENPMLGWVELQLAIGDTSQQLAALERWTDELLNEGRNGIVQNNWEPWTAEIISLILRTDEAGRVNEWNENTPGLTDLTTKLQSLIDLWFQQTDGVVQELTDKCIQGEIEYRFEALRMINISKWIVNHLELEERDEHLEAWASNLRKCQQLIVTWQANVVTHADGFTSDISLGVEVGDDQALFGITRDSQILEVEFIEGFWKDTCLPTDGTAALTLLIDDDSRNLGLAGIQETLNNLIVYVKIIEPVYLDCSPSGFELSADAQAPFHGAALEQLNKDRLVEEGEYAGYWKFELEYDPGGGVVAQFEESLPELAFSDGTYELWQLVTVYQATPAE